MQRIPQKSDPDFKNLKALSGRTAGNSGIAIRHTDCIIIDVMRRLLFCSLILFSVITTACKDITGVKTDDFALYPLENDSLRAEQVASVAMDDLDIKNEPVISVFELHSYDWQDHSMSLMPKVSDKLEQILHKKNIAGGIPFVLVAGGERIYTGSFVAVWSSYMPKMPHILLSPVYTDTVVTLSIQSGMSSANVREDMRIYEALKAAGKLVE